MIKLLIKERLNWVVNVSEYPTGCLQSCHNMSRSCFISVIHWSLSINCVFFQMPPQRTKLGTDPKPFGYPVDITTLAMLSSLIQNTITLSWYREVGKVISPVIFTYLWYKSILFTLLPRIVVYIIVCVCVCVCLPSMLWLDLSVGLNDSAQSVLAA